MRQHIDALLGLLDEYEKEEEYLELSLRLSLSRMILRGLKRKGWTQSRLAKEIGRKDPFISRIVNGDENWTVRTAARILFALGMTAEVQETDEDVIEFCVGRAESLAEAGHFWGSPWTGGHAASESRAPESAGQQLKLVTEEETNGKEESLEIDLGRTGSVGETTIAAKQG